MFKVFLHFIIITENLWMSSLNCSSFNKSYKKEQFNQMDASRNRLLLRTKESFNWSSSFEMCRSGVRVYSYVSRLRHRNRRSCRPVAYTSKTFMETWQNYSTPEKELLELQTWKSYFHGSKFTIMTDHCSLKYLDT